MKCRGCEIEERTTTLPKGDQIQDIIDNIEEYASESDSYGGPDRRMTWLVCYLHACNFEAKDVVHLLMEHSDLRRAGKWHPAKIMKWVAETFGNVPVRRVVFRRPVVPWGVACSSARRYRKRLLGGAAYVIPED